MKLRLKRMEGIEREREICAYTHWLERKRKMGFNCPAIFPYLFTIALLKSHWVPSLYAMWPPPSNCRWKYHLPCYSMLKIITTLDIPIPILLNFNNIKIKKKYYRNWWCIYIKDGKKKCWIYSVYYERCRNIDILKERKLAAYFSCDLLLLIFYFQFLPYLGGGGGN